MTGIQASGLNLDPEEMDQLVLLAALVQLVQPDLPDQLEPLGAQVRQALLVPRDRQEELGLLELLQQFPLGQHQQVQQQ